jgi:uncharacterized protein involved in outer membrane biogenesis
MDGSLLTRQALKWTVRTLAVLIVVIAALAAAAALVDAKHFRAPLIRLIAARTGRQIRIEGSLEVHLLSFTPQVLAERVTIGNPPWMPPGSTAEIGRLSLAFELLPLFADSYVIRRLEMESATLHLVRNSADRANWQWTEPGSAGGTGMPLIQSLSMPEAHVELDDARRHLQFDGTVSAQDVAGAGGVESLHIEGRGQLNGRAATFAINGDPLATVRREQPYRFAVAERSSRSRLDGRGFLPRPFDFRALDITFEAAGEDLKDLYFLTGVTLPNTGSYHLSGKLAREGMHFQYSDLLVTCGQSDLHGTLSIETSSDRPKLEADLYSQLLRVADLGARAAARAAESQAPNPLLLPDSPLPLAGMLHSDAVANFHARGVQVGRVPLHAVAAQLTIDHGVFTVAPLTAAFPEGKITGRVRVDATHEVPTADFDLRIADLRLGQFARKNTGQPSFDGLLQAHLRLAGHGSSIHQFAATANGTVTAVLPHGAIRASFAELTGVDLARGLGLLLSKNREDTAVRCGIASFLAHEGMLTAQSLVVDTAPVLITGNGEIHLDSETLNLTLRGRPKSRRLLRLDSPVLIRGTLAHPSVALDARESLAQTGKALTLGIVLTPLEVLGFVDPGLAKDADCAALLAEAKTDGVPVNAGAPAR